MGWGLCLGASNSHTQPNNPGSLGGGPDLGDMGAPLVWGPPPSGPVQRQGCCGWVSAAQSPVELVTQRDQNSVDFLAQGVMYRTLELQAHNHRPHSMSVPCYWSVLDTIGVS